MKTFLHFLQEMSLIDLSTKSPGFASLIYTFNKNGLKGVLNDFSLSQIEIYLKTDKDPEDKKLLIGLKQLFIDKKNVEKEFLILNKKYPWDEK